MPRAKASKAKRAKLKREKEQALALLANSDDQSLVDRYHAMAEELNGRGAMELAVPFYRQTIALLLAERERLRAVAGRPAPAALQASADVQGVMAAAASVDCALTETELLRQLSALEEELSPSNLMELTAALEVLDEQWGQPHPQLLALRARVHLLAGDLHEARACFERALELDQGCVRLRLNTGAARLAVGDARAALELLRPLVEQRDSLDALNAAGSYWNNLVRAELAADQAVHAAAALQQWLAHVPHTLEPDDWIEEARALDAAGKREDAVVLLQALADAGSTELRRAVLPELAEQLEAAGAFRDAALLYRELLRPGLSA